MDVFYFGDEGQLFGCYHEPEAGFHQACGIVLCYPMGQEYIRAHRAVRQLAVLLAQAGFPVLRFDFSGCGDSSGSDGEGTIGQWLDDIPAAIEELKSRSAATRMCLVGLRLGGALAVMVGAERGDIDRMILWDPVVNGAAYAEELPTAHRELMQRFMSESSTGGNHTEILGFRLHDTVLEDLNKLDLLAVQRKPANTVLVIESGEAAGAGPFVAHLEGLGAEVAYEQVDGPKIWERHEEYSLLVPTRLLRSIVSSMSEEDSV